MNNVEIKKKIKSQKNAAIILIIGPMIVLLTYFRKNDFEIKNLNNFIIVCSLIVLIICGGIGLKNSLRKEKELSK
jgi:hypothetical protein